MNFKHCRINPCNATTDQLSKHSLQLVQSFNQGAEILLTKSSRCYTLCFSYSALSSSGGTLLLLHTVGAVVLNTLNNPLVDLSSRRVGDFVEERLALVAASCYPGV